jgi:uncharacterized membrane protein YgdD (TMEM256/DUF423 family)
MTISTTRAELMNGKTWLIIAAVLGGSGVALGAFGAHGLDGAIGGWISDAALVEKRLGDWDVAVRYQMVHALAMLAVGLLALRRPSLAANLAGGCFLLGPAIFSGCLYALVLSYAVAPGGWTWLGAIVPIGGVLMIAGWACLAVAAARLPEASKSL